MTIRICHLYGNLLNTYGDRGNVLMLAHHAKILGHNVSIEVVSLQMTFDPERYNLVFIGGGQDHEQRIIAGDLPSKNAALTSYIQSGGVMLAICGGYQLLGKYYETPDGTRILGAGILPHYTAGSSAKRLVGNVDIMSGHFLMPLSGFENHAGRTYLGENEQPLGMVLKGFGNNGEDGTEGAIFKNVSCSYFHGPLLVRNPKLATRLVQQATERTIRSL